MRLFVDGQPPIADASVNLFSNASNSANVYNTLGLYESAIIDSTSDSVDLFLKSEAPDFIQESGLNLYSSGIGFNTDTMTLRIRGF
jgi:hypothetical protein